MNAPLRHPLALATRRIAPLARLPLFFALDGRRAVLAGDSAAVAWKAELLLAAGAHVEVYATAPCYELLAAGVPIIRRRWTADDLHGAALAIGGFDDDAAASSFAAAARSLGVPVNVIDRPVFCDFSFGAIVNRSPLVIGVSTDGAAPVLAQYIRSRIEALLPQGLARWLEVAARWRGAVKQSGLSFVARRTFWRLFAERAMSAADSVPQERDLRDLLGSVKNAGAATESGSLTVIENVPHDPDFLTLRDARALQSADVILFAPAISPTILDFARREAVRMLFRGEDGDSRIVELVAEGKRVVRLRAARPA